VNSGLDAHQEKDFLMTSRNQIVNLKNIFTFVMTIVIFLANVTPTQAKENLPSLTSFIESVKDGNAKTLRGVYVHGLMAYPIVSQPTGQPGFVSNDSKVITQFGMATDAGNVGLLAHNYLAGSNFIQLAVGQQVDLVYGDGRVESFIVSEVLKYQALDPNNPSSKFRSLNGEITLTADELFRQVYRGERHITFQTCIEANGNFSWGRLFIIATPKPAK
jgi:hypothetical protein